MHFSCSSSLPSSMLFPFLFFKHFHSPSLASFLHPASYSVLSRPMSQNNRKKIRTSWRSAVCMYLYLRMQDQFKVWVPTVHGFKTNRPSRCRSSVVWLLFFLFGLDFLLLQSYPFNLMKRMNTTAVPGTKTERRCSRTLLILAEIQKTDLAWTGVDFVEIKENLPHPPPSSCQSPSEGSAKTSPYFNTNREDEERRFHSAVTHFNCSCIQKDWDWKHLEYNAWKEINWLRHCQ
jgi:hypothetical protein